MNNHMNRIPVIILYSRLRTGIPLRSKLLHCRKRWWKHATQTTARPRSSNFVFFPCSSAKTGKKGPFGCVVANKRFSNPFVELLQNVQIVKVGSPFVEGVELILTCNSVVAIILMIHTQNSLSEKLTTEYKRCY